MPVLTVQASGSNGRLDVPAPPLAIHAAVSGVEEDIAFEQLPRLS